MTTGTGTEPKITVECGDCHHELLRWSNSYPQGLTLAQLDEMGWVFDDSLHEWRCPTCWEREHVR